MSFTKNLTRAINAQPLRQQRSSFTYATGAHEPLEYRLSKLSLSKMKQESARPEPDLRHVVGYASVNRAVGDKMYQNLVRSVELLRTERRSKAAGRSRLAASAARGMQDDGLAVLVQELGVETRRVDEGEVEARGRRRKSLGSKRLRGVREERVVEG